MQIEVTRQPPPVDPLPEVPSAELTVIPVPGNAPEDVVVDAAGNIWTGVDDGRIVLNEVNTLPGFTSYSRYPRMMAAAGVDRSQLIDRLIALARER